MQENVRHKMCSHKSQRSDRRLFNVSPSLKKQEFTLYFLFYDTRLHLEAITTRIIRVCSVTPRGAEASVILPGGSRTLALSSAVMFELQLHLFLLLYIQSIWTHPASDFEDRLLSQAQAYNFNPLLPTKRAQICLEVSEYSDLSLRGKNCCAVGFAASLSAKWRLMAVRPGLLSLIKISWRLLDVYDVESSFSAVLIEARILGFGGEFKATAAGFVFSRWTSFLLYDLPEQTPGPGKLLALLQAQRESTRSPLSPWETFYLEITLKQQ